MNFSLRDSKNNLLFHEAIPSKALKWFLLITFIQRVSPNLRACADANQTTIVASSLNDEYILKVHVYFGCY